MTGEAGGVLVTNYLLRTSLIASLQRFRNKMILQIRSVPSLICSHSKNFFITSIFSLTISLCVLFATSEFLFLFDKYFMINICTKTTKLDVVSSMKTKSVVVWSLNMESLNIEF